MPRIDFYLLNSANDETRLHFVCRLVEKAYRQKHRIYIHTENETHAHTLDELLWTYRDDSFLPHHLSGDGPNPPPPIQIGYQAAPQKQNDILINLNSEVPDFYRQFSRVLELVAADPLSKAKARDHYKLYREAGFKIHTHSLQTITES